MLLDGESLDERGGMTAYVPVHMAQGARRRIVARRRDVVTGGMRLRRDGGHPAGDPPAAMRQRPTGRRCGSGGPGRTRLRRSSGKDCCAQKCTHLSLTGSGAGSHRGEHKRAAVHREGPQVGEGPESGGALRGLRRSRVAWNALCGPSQNDREGPEEGDRQGTARQDARRPWDRQGRLPGDGTTNMSPEDRKHA